MSEPLHELGTLLVRERYGFHCSQIFDTIARYNRLTHVQLRRRLPTIDRRNLRHAIIRLLKHHILLYSYNIDRIAHFQINWSNTYAIVRGGTIARLAQEKHGQDAAKIITDLLHLGHASVGRLAQAFEIESDYVPHNGTGTSNGYANGDGVPNGDPADKPTEASSPKYTARFHTALRHLLRSGFLVKTNERAYLPGADLQHQIEEAVMDESFPDGKVTGPKKEKEFRGAVNELKRKWREDDDFNEHRDCADETLFNRANKRVKLNGGQKRTVNQGGDDDEPVVKLRSDMVVRINHGQCAYAIRTKQLRQLSEKAFGGITASVYGALLQVLESKLLAREQRVSPQDDEEDGYEDPDYALPTASLMEISKMLDPDVDLSDSIRDPNDMPKQTNGKRKGKLGYQDEDHRELGIKTEIFSDDEDDESASGDQAPNGNQPNGSRHRRLGIIEEHLGVLQEHEKGFCERTGGGNRSEWRVDFPALSIQLINDLIEKTVTDKYDEPYARVIRLLRDMGKLEDKQVTAIAMMTPRDLRSIMTQLQYAGWIDVQEVPKDNKRQPNRTIYLWYHEPKEVQMWALRKTYKAMSRALQRLEAEREHYSDAIWKSELPLHEQESLNRNEREAIVQWREVEERINIQLQRLDEDVTVWRDFSRRDTSLAS